MVDLSNKSLALLLLVAIVVSIGGTMLSLSRMSDLGPTGNIGENLSGYTNFSISSQLSIRFLNSGIDFGNGYINGSHVFCTMGTNNTAPDRNGLSGCVLFQTPPTNLTIENDGNLYANVSLNFSANATKFIGGTLATESFRYQVIAGEGNPCYNETTGAYTTDLGRNGTAHDPDADTNDFKEVGTNETQGGGARVCDSLQFDNSNDLIEVGVWLKIPADAAQTAHNVYIWANGCNDNSC